MSDELVQYESWDDLVRGTYNQGIEAVLKSRFRNGLDRFDINKTELEEKQKTLVEFEQTDQDNYKNKSKEAEKEHVAKHGSKVRYLWKKVWGKIEEFVPPDFESSLETTVYENLVEVGTTLSGYVGKLRQFSQAFMKMGTKHKELCQREEQLRTEEVVINGRLEHYTKEAKEITCFLEALEGYDELCLEERNGIMNGEKDNIPIPLHCLEIREAYSRMLKEGLFSLGQSREDDLTELQVVGIGLKSIYRQITSLKQQASHLWELYNPARVEAAQLKAAYEELSSAAESGTLITQVSATLQNAKELCDKARESQRNLESAVEANMESYHIQRQLTNLPLDEDTALTNQIKEAYQLTEK